MCVTSSERALGLYALGVCVPPHGWFGVSCHAAKARVPFGLRA